jgi:prepilin-type processing-associated H-X9-DG protein
LLVVIATLAVLTAMVLPAFASAKPNNQATQCLNNHRRLAAAWNMFPSDNNGEIMRNPGWVGGMMNWSVSASDMTPLTDPAQSAIAHYVKSPALFKCPADEYQSAGQFAPRARSVSMNGAMAGLGGSGPPVGGFAPGGGRYYGAGSMGAGGPVRNLSQLTTPGPTYTFLIIDEHPDSINDAFFTHEPGYPPGQERWRVLPASYHSGGVGISYADGRAEIYQWKERTGINKSIYPVTMNASPPPWGSLMINSSDYKWLTARMPYLEQ